jgi:hypothetical protein
MSATPPALRGGLLERGDSLAALEAALGEVRSSTQGQLVLVAGEAGVGKTALLRAFCEAEGGSASVVRTRGEAGAEAVRLGLSPAQDG